MPRRTVFRHLALARLTRVRRCTKLTRIAIVGSVTRAHIDTILRHRTKLAGATIDGSPTLAFGNTLANDRTNLASHAFILGSTTEISDAIAAATDIKRMIIMNKAVWRAGALSFGDTATDGTAK